MAVGTLRCSRAALPEHSRCKDAPPFIVMHPQLHAGRCLSQATRTFQLSCITPSLTSAAARLASVLLLPLFGHGISDARAVPRLPRVDVRPASHPFKAVQGSLQRVPPHLPGPQQRIARVQPAAQRRVQHLAGGPRGSRPAQPGGGGGGGRREQGLKGQQWTQVRRSQASRDDAPSPAPLPHPT